MSRHKRMLPVFLAAAVALIVGVAAPGGWVATPEGWDAAPGGWDVDDGGLVIVIPFDDAEMFFEFNATDGDLGIQAFLDGEAWRKISIVGPDGRIFGVKGEGNLKELGLTELFFESEEPELGEDISFEEFLDMFPEGEYQFSGKTVDKGMLMSTATLTHVIPAAPEILSPEPEEDEVVDPNEPFIIEWELVTEPEGIEIVAYQVIVEKDEEEERLRVLSADMLSTDTSLTVAPGFLEAGKEYKVEVLAIEASGNKTITEVPFETEDDE